MSLLCSHVACIYESKGVCGNAQVNGMAAEAQEVNRLSQEALALTARLDTLKRQGEPLIARLREIGTEIDRLRPNPSAENVARMLELAEEGEQLQEQVRAIGAEAGRSWPCSMPGAWSPTILGSPARAILATRSTWGMP